eukprot:scaffold5302_cov174-Isochrysis_galbana.AAC.1
MQTRKTTVPTGKDCATPSSGADGGGTLKGSGSGGSNACADEPGGGPIGVDIADRSAPDQQGVSLPSSERLFPPCPEREGPDERD